MLEKLPFWLVSRLTVEAERRWPVGKKTESVRKQSYLNIRVDLSRTSVIQRLHKTQGMDGISFTVHPG